MKPNPWGASMKRLTRRQFVATAGAAATVTLFGQSRRGEALPALPVVRRDVGRMDGSDPILVSYRKAIKAMQSLPATNPLSWAYQAAIHGTMAAPMLTAWNTCEHGTDYFWSWHRMYLYWF